MNSASLLQLLNEIKYSSDTLTKLHEAGFAVTDRTDEGDSVLHLLAKSIHAGYKYFYYLEELMNAGADIGAIDKQNNTFLNYYLENNQYGQGEIFAFLLKRDDVDINQTVKNDQTLFESIYHSPDWSCDEAMELFIKHKKFNPNLKTSKYPSILLHMISEDTYAHRERIYDVANNLQANPNIKNKDGQTALGWLLSRTQYKDMELIAALINHEQCDINLLDENGNNYLQLAIISCQWQEDDIASLLINKVINVAHKNKQGQSVFDLILENKVGRSDYVKSNLLIKLLTHHPASLLEQYNNGQPILSEIIKSGDYKLRSELTTFIKRCKEQNNGEAFFKKIVTTCFEDFRQGLVSEDAIIALTGAFIGAHVTIDIEYCLALTAIRKPTAYAEKRINNNFKKLNFQPDLKVVITHLKHLTQGKHDEHLRALSCLSKFDFYSSDLDDDTLALKDECFHAELRQDVEKASNLFGHLFSLSDLIPENNRLIDLTGSHSRDTAAFMVHLVNAYFSHCIKNGKYKAYLDVIQKVRNMTVKAMYFLLIMSDSSASKEHILLSMAEDSKNSGVEIITGWPGHAMNIIIKQDDLYRNNGGGCSTDSTTEHYKISKPHHLTQDVFSTLYENKEEESNKTYIQQDLHHLLGLAFVDSISGRFQTVGNCGLYSLLIALKTKYRLFLPEQTADHLFTETIKFFEQFYLEEYLDLHASNPAAPHLLMRLIIQKLIPEGQIELIKQLLVKHFNSDINQDILHIELMLKRWELVLYKEPIEHFDKQLQALGIQLEPKNTRQHMLQRILNDQLTLNDLDELKSWSLSQQMFQGYHVLHLAVMNNNLELALLLIQIFPDAVNKANWFNKEPLCLVNSVEMIDVLIKAGAHLSRTTEGNALDCAIKANRADLVSALLKHGAKTSEYSAYVAASRGPEILEPLMVYHPKAVIEPTHDYRTSLHAAASSGHNKNVCSLIYHGGVNPNSTDVNGITPLQLALKKGHPDTAKLLIEYPGTLFQAPHRGESIMKMTQDEGIQKAMILKEQERKADLEYFETTFKKNNPGIIEEDIDYLIVAVRMNDLRAIRGCLLSFPHTKVTNTSNLYCTTPLGEAIRRLAGTKGEEYKAAFQLVEMLLKTPAIDINAIQASSEPMLFWPTSIGDADILELFLADRKLDPNQQDSIGHTALHDAVARGHLACVKRLLADKRVDSTIRNKRKQTAAELNGFGYNFSQCIEEVLKYQKCIEQSGMNLAS